MNASEETGSLPRPPAPADPNAFYGGPIVPVAAVTITLSTLFVGMRLYSRAVILRVMALEDWILVLGWICAAAISAANIAQLENGLGRSAGLPPETLIRYLKTAWAINVIYIFSLVFVKISILCLYLRAINYGYVRLATKVLLGIVLITHAWILASLFTVCVPLDAFWDFSKKATAYCHPFSVYWSHSGINIGTDFLIFALPLTVFHKLRVPRREKVALYFVFLLAFCVCIISLVRTLLFLNGNPRSDRDTVVVACWTLFEVHVAVTCACLTTIKPLLSRLFPRILLPSLGRAGSGSSDGDDDVNAAAGGVETIGRARQHRRARHAHHDPLDDTDVMTTTTTTITSSGYTGSAQSSTIVGAEKLNTVEEKAGDHGEGSSGRR